MANGTGTAVINFGAHPGDNEASVTVADQTAITVNSKVEAWVMGGDTTSDHTAADHRYFPVFASLTCGTPTAGVGFTIYAISTQKLTGTWAVRYVWAD